MKNDVLDHTEAWPSSLVYNDEPRKALSRLQFKYIPFWVSKLFWQKINCPSAQSSIASFRVLWMQAHDSLYSVKSMWICVSLPRVAKSNSKYLSGWILSREKKSPYLLWYLHIIYWKWIDNWTVCNVSLYKMKSVQRKKCVFTANVLTRFDMSSHKKWCHRILSWNESYQGP